MRPFSLRHWRTTNREVAAANCIATNKARGQAHGLAFNRPRQAVRSRRLALLLIVAVMGLSNCTDAATRLAYDLETGANALRTSSEPSRIIEHVMKAEPAGCPGPYTVQLSRASSLLIWCDDPAGGRPIASHTTTYHLRYVEVPLTLLVHKQANERTLIELTKAGNQIVVTGMR